MLDLFFSLTVSCEFGLSHDLNCSDLLIIVSEAFAGCSSDLPADCPSIFTLFTLPMGLASPLYQLPV